MFVKLIKFHFFETTEFKRNVSRLESPREPISQHN